MSAVKWFNFSQMEVNPDKFLAMIFSNKHHPNKEKIDVAGKHIPCNSSVRLLGIDIWQQIVFG